MIQVLGDNLSPREGWLHCEPASRFQRNVVSSCVEKLRGEGSGCPLQKCKNLVLCAIWNSPDAVSLWIGLHVEAQKRMAKVSNEVLKGIYSSGKLVKHNCYQKYNAVTNFNV